MRTFAVAKKAYNIVIYNFYELYFVNYRLADGYYIGEPYESGIPTRGSSWLPVSVGFYLFAILFLMFDIETVFLYPWAVVVKEFGVAALLSIGFFLVVLVLGLAYAWRKGDLEWK